MQKIPVLLITVLLAACATPATVQGNLDPDAVRQEQARQKVMAVEYNLKANQRVMKVASPILTQNIDLCGEKVSGRVGFEMLSYSSVSKDWREAYVTLGVLDKDDRITVSQVAANWPAERAGLQRGDVIISINGQSVTKGKRGHRKAAQLLSKALAKEPHQPVDLSIERGGVPQTLSLAPLKACSTRVVAVQGDEVNAWADGKTVSVTYGMLRFVENDDELAVVLSHEIGHNVMLHIEKMQRNAMTGAIAGAFLDGLAAAYGVNTNGEYSKLGGQIGQQAYSVEFEQEADYSGVYLAERAGYDMSVAPNFWRRMAINSSASISYSQSHPTTAARFLALESTNTEISNKKMTGETLAPNLKE